MTAYAGKDGVVKIANTVVGEIRSFSFEETAETLETTAMGDTYREYISSYKNWTGTIDVLWDPDDTGQTAATIGSEVTVVFYPEGSGSGDTEISGDAIITGITTNSTFDGLVEKSISLQGSGVLTKDTV